MNREKEPMNPDEDNLDEILNEAREIQERVEAKVREAKKRYEEESEVTRSSKPKPNWKRYFQNNTFWRLYLVSFTSSVYFAFDISSGVRGEDNFLLDLLFSLVIAFFWIPGVALILAFVGAIAEWVYRDD